MDPLLIIEYSDGLKVVYNRNADVLAEGHNLTFEDALDMLDIPYEVDRGYYKYMESEEGS